MVNKKIRLSSIEDVKEFTSIVNMQECEIDLRSGKYIVDAKSIMGIFSLDLSKSIDLEIHSENCTDLLEQIGKFIENK